MNRPWISINLAMSADGKLSSVSRIPSGWTSRADHDRLLSLRGNADALLVGRGTLEADRMTLTVPGDGPQPLRCVASRSGDFDPAHPLFSKPGGPIHLLQTSASGAGNTGRFPNATWHRESLPGFLARLHDEHGVRRLHCEGGGELIRSLEELGVIDEIHLTFAAHTLFGGRNAPTVTGVPGPFLSKAGQYRLVHMDPRPELGECFASYQRV